jgi:hypothetical protein
MEDGMPMTEGSEGNPVYFTRPKLTKHFTLGMKHHALYTALLPKLAELEKFNIIAVIRHPLDTIASWQKTGKHAIAQGKLPAAARFWPEAARISASKENKLTRMVQLYDAHLERYHQLRDRIHIVKYEEVIENPAIVSQLVGSGAMSAAVPMINPPPRIRVSSEAEELRALIKKYGVFTKYYYSKI